MGRKKTMGGMVIELVWTILFAISLVLSIVLQMEWYFVLGAAVFFLWCLRSFIREIKDKDVEKSAEVRKRIDDEIGRRDNTQ